MNYRFILSYIKNETITQSVKPVLREKKYSNNNNTTIIYNNNNINCNDVNEAYISVW